MGKVITFLTILIFIDILFIATGQLFASGTPTLTSIILNGIINLADLNFTAFFTEIIGDFSDLFSSTTGLAALAVGAGVLVSTFFISAELRLFVPIALTLGLLASDFIVIFMILRASNALLATFIFAPIILIYVFTVVEWLKNKD